MEKLITIQYNLAGENETREVKEYLRDLGFTFKETNLGRGGHITRVYDRDKEQGIVMRMADQYEIHEVVSGSRLELELDDRMSDNSITEAELAEQRLG